MTFIEVPDCALAVLEYGDANYQWTNNLWFYKASFSTSDMEALADEIHDGLMVDSLQVLGDGWYARGITIYDMSSENAPKYEYTMTPTAGLQAGAEASIGGACVITFYTGNRGKSYRGRNYWTGYVEEEVSAVGVGNSEVAAPLVTAYLGMKVDVASIGWTWVVVSRYANGAPRASGIYTPVTTASVRSTTYGSQRRRLRRA